MRWAGCGVHCSCTSHKILCKYNIFTLLKFPQNKLCSPSLSLLSEFKKDVEPEVIQMEGAMVKDYHVISLTVLQETARSLLLFNLMLITFHTLT